MSPEFASLLRFEIEAALVALAVLTTVWILWHRLTRGALVGLPGFGATAPGDDVGLRADLVRALHTPALPASMRASGDAAERRLGPPHLRLLRARPAGDSWILLVVNEGGPMRHVLAGPGTRAVSGPEEWGPTAGGCIVLRGDDGRAHACLTFAVAYVDAVGRTRTERYHFVPAVQVLRPAARA